MTRLQSLHGALPQTKYSPPRRAEAQKTSDQPTRPTDSAEISAAGSKSRRVGMGLFAKLVTFGMAAGALVGCTGSGAANPVAQQLTEPTVLEKVQPANPFELMRMNDGSLAVSADLAHDDAYVLANREAVRQDGGGDVAQRTAEGSTLCQQAEALGGSCEGPETAVVPTPDGNYIVETFAREGEPIHRLEARPQGQADGGITLNKLPDGTEVFSDNGSGLLLHNGDMQAYPGFFQ